MKLYKTFLPFLLLMVSNMFVNAQDFRLYVGTYTSGASEGIYAFRFDATTGKAYPIDTARGVSNPSYLCISRDGNFLYAVNENGGAKPGALSAFSIDAASGKLHFLNSRPSEGDYPCYITVSKNRKWVFAANYGGGSLVGYALAPDGSLSDNKQFIRHQGKGTDPGRQEGPHVHSTTFTPSEDFLLVCDLGLDKIFSYRFRENADSSPLQAAQPPYANTQPAHGPRHIDFHPNGKWFYLMEEMSGFVSAWTYKKGRMESFQLIDAHEKGYTGERGSADIHLSPDGKFLYASNRFASNNIAIFAVNEKNGRLASIGFQSLQGRKPRNFVIDPTGKFLLVANQDSDDIEVYRRDPVSGLLQRTENTIRVGSPVCLKMVAY